LSLLYSYEIFFSIGFFSQFFHEAYSQVDNVDYVSSGYNKNIYMSDSLFLEKDYQTCFYTLKKNFKNHKPIQTQPYSELSMYIKSAFLSGKKRIARKNLKLLVRNYGYTLSQLTKDSIFSKIVDEKVEFGYEDLREKFISKSYFNYKDSLLISEVV